MPPEMLEDVRAESVRLAAEHGVNLDENAIEGTDDQFTWKLSDGEGFERFVTFAALGRAFVLNRTRVRRLDMLAHMFRQGVSVLRNSVAV